VVAEVWVETGRGGKREKKEEGREGYARN